MKTIKLILFWFVHCTWGIIMTLVGSVGALVMLVTGHKPKKHGYSIYFVTGHGWGGVCLGPFFFVSDDCDDIDSKTHEAGHSLFQAMPMGPLFPFLVGIPSMLRYYLFDFDTRLKRLNFMTIVVSVAALVGLVLAALGVAFHIITLIVIGTLIVVYAICIFIWLYASEIDKMDNPSYGYYDIWFERDASKYGLANYYKNKKELKYE